MCPAAVSPSFPALLDAAPELGDYVQFSPCEIPNKSGAIRAYKGYIRPFSNDENARQVLRAFKTDAPIQVCGGRLSVDASLLPPHELEQFLVGMAEPLTVMVLEVDDSPHPRAYLLDPLMVPRLTGSPHRRPDKSILIDGRKIPALCVYSGALQNFDGNRSRLEQFLDQTATYVAKYLIWLRTRALYRRTQHGRKLVQPRVAQKEITAAEINKDQELFWDGHWPGRVAPSGPDQHLATIKPEDECWCWTGKAYGTCHRPEEFELVTRLERHQFVIKIMAAVHTKLRAQAT